MNILLGLKIVILLRSVRSVIAKSERFEVLNGFRISSGSTKSVYSAFGRIHCAVVCLQANSCHSANFDTATNTCEINTETMTDETTFIVEQQTWEFFHSGLKDVWRLVFRGTAGIGIAIYDSWIGSVSLPEATDSCKLTQSSGCLTHYRSSMLDHWSENSIKKVRFSLYKNNSIVVSMVFSNMADDNNTRWFSKDRLVHSSYQDMTPTSYYKYFTAHGTHPRRFYISYSWSQCPNDIGWIAVYDDAGICPYENGLHYPYFGYAPNNQKGNSMDFLSADVLAVFIKPG